MILGTVLLPLIDVLTEVGFASAYPQLLAWHGTSLRASSIVAAGPLAAVTTGWIWGRIVRRRGLARGGGLLLSAFELLVPTVIEAHTSRPLLGKITAMAFEIAVVVGVIVKARLVGLFRWLPVLTAAMIAVGCVVASNLPVLVVILLGVGLGIGAQVSMGNELAALSVRGFETAGMGAYATLRITGSFAGPMFLTIPFPLLLAALAAVALLAEIPLSRSV